MQKIQRPSTVASNIYREKASNAILIAAQAAWQWPMVRIQWLEVARAAKARARVT